MRFRALRRRNRCGLVAFHMAGDPDLETCAAILSRMPADGVDLIEIGVPFTDPTADGPSIQKAGRRALAAGGGLSAALDLAQNFRRHDTDTPLVLMGYVNSLLGPCPEHAAARLAEAGADGAIVVDLPWEEEAVIRAAFDAAGLALIRLIAPTATDARLDRCLENAPGFVYCVSTAGVTGGARGAVDDVARMIDRVRQRTDTPVAVGFGVRTPAHAEAYRDMADAVVVGSALADATSEGPFADAPGRVGAVLQSLSDALDRAT